MSDGASHSEGANTMETALSPMLCANVSATARRQASAPVLFLVVGDHDHQVEHPVKRRPFTRQWQT